MRLSHTQIHQSSQNAKRSSISSFDSSTIQRKSPATCRNSDTSRLLYATARPATFYGVKRLGFAASNKRFVWHTESVETKQAAHPEFHI